MGTAGVAIGTEPRDWLHEVADHCGGAAGDVTAALSLARELGDRLAPPGQGRTVDRWACLATLGACDLTVARAVEPHLDARAILAERPAPERAELVPDDATFGVWAAEGPGVRVAAHPDVSNCGAPTSWRLCGTKPWCSLADEVSHGLVTGWVDETHRALFAVPVRQPGVEVGDEPWVPHGLRRIRSGPVTFSEARAVMIGPPGWYLERDGFAWGGIGVAAVWFGGAVGLARVLQDAAARREPDQIGLAHLGTVDAALHGSRAVLGRAATAVDSGRAGGEAGAVLALQVRQVVADACELVLRTVDHALGPGPLVTDPEHIERVSDLRVYLRQHHAERDLAALGRSVVGRSAAGRRPW